MATPKEVEIKARVTVELKKTVEAIADDRGESVSVIVREAVQQYISRKKGESLSTAKSKSPTKEKRSHLRDIREVSLSIWATIPAGWPETRRAIKPKRTVMVPKGMYPPNAFGLDVIGDSMNAAKGKFGPVLPGETVVLVPFTSGDEAAGKIVAAMIDGRTTLKRLVCPKSAACHLRAESTNPAFANCIRPLHDLTVQGVVIGKL